MARPFSVLMSVYKKDKASDVRQAIKSIYDRQTLRPTEIILMVDGPVTPELNELIEQESRRLSCLVVHRFNENKGLGQALQAGVELASNEIIARMDSDDIAVPKRFELQLAYLDRHPDVSIVGGQIEEFVGEQANIVGRRSVPHEHSEIAGYIKSRCPFNHMSVAFRKSAVFKAGNYRPWHFNEDYYLWIRMFENGLIMANLPDVLVKVRVGCEMYRRRGGWRYFKSEARLQSYMLRHGIIGVPRYIYNVAGRFAVQVAMPNCVRGFIFQKLFRK